MQILLINYWYETMFICNVGGHTNAGEFVHPWFSKKQQHPLLKQIVN